MKKFRKILTMCLTMVITISTMSISSFASESQTNDAIAVAEESGYTVIENMIDYSIYDGDMVYIQEHADAIEEYNKSLTEKNELLKATSYSAWNMNQVYSFTSRNASLKSIPYYFVPTTTSMYFNAKVENVGDRPYMAVNIVTNPSTGTLSYVGSYYIDPKSGTTDTYEWNNYKRALSKGTKYTFTLMAYSSWTYAEMDIYKSAM